MSTLLIILTVILAIIAMFSYLIIRRSAKDTRRMAESLESAERTAELKATLPPDIKIGSRMHDHPGVYIKYTIIGRSEFPISLEKITLKSWDRDNPTKKYPFVHKRLAGELAKGDDPVDGKFLCPRHNFESDETRNEETMMGWNLFKRISGELCLSYLEHSGELKEKCQSIGVIMT